MPARTLTAAALALACLVAGCGGGDDKATPADVQQVVKDFAKAVNNRDGKTFCNELTTRSYLEKVTAAKGDSAVKQCETQIGSLQLQQKYKVVKFTKTTIKGDSATVIALLELQGQRRPQVFRLRKENGKFRLTSGG
jgi:ketosteroid isomerase-like protein